LCEVLKVFKIILILKIFKLFIIQFESLKRFEKKEKKPNLSNPKPNPRPTFLLLPVAAQLPASGPTGPPAPAPLPLPHVVTDRWGPHVGPFPYL
jgi:hypothetical protein